MNVHVTIFDTFAAPELGPECWGGVQTRGDSDVVFLTWQWQRSWWECFGRGKLLLLAARRDGDIVALAPFFTESGMIYFVGAGGSDYLDFVGDISEPEVLDALLGTAQRQVPDFIGFVFHHVSEQSRTGRLLGDAAGRLGLKIFDEGGWPAPALELAAQPVAARDAVNKKSLVRHERFFARDDTLKVSHLTRSEEILPHLEGFFAQHRARWAATPYPSLFCDDAQRRFYRSLTPAAADAGWLRFTQVEWQGRSIAYHFGFCYRGSFMWYKPTFAIDLARHSPGEVLLRQLLLAAIAENASAFDFGLGDEAFKSRFATRVAHVKNWGLYDPRALPPPSSAAS